MHDSPAVGPAARLPHAEFVAIVALLMALNAMAVDVILPALQQMGSSLSVADENSRQLPQTAYIVAFGVSQLFYGSISDRYGRRPVLMVGLAIYALGCVGGAMATSFPQLLAMRAVQGIRAGATRVIAVAVVRDTFGGRRMASIMSLAMMVFMVVPIFAPNIGQGILMIAGWRGILVFIAVFGIAMLAWCYLRLPETPRGPEPAVAARRPGLASLQDRHHQPAGLRLFARNGARFRLPVRLPQFGAADLSGDLRPWSALPPRLLRRARS